MYSLRSLVPMLVLGCSASPAAAPLDANGCVGLAESDCNAHVGCFAAYSTSNESGQVGGDFLGCAAGEAICKLPAGCGYGGVGCPQNFTVAFTLENPDVCDVGVAISCVHPVACTP